MTIIEQIKANLDIVQVISTYVPLKPKGKNFVACCPFHQENTPSFYVAPDKQRWRCFGACSEGGDLIDFIMKQEHLSSTIEAIKILAPLAGVDFEERQESPQYDRLYALMVEATDYFHQSLRSHKLGGTALEYLKGRGFVPETLKTWKIGYAPLNWSGLIKVLMSKGFTDQEMLDAGVVVEHKGKLLDRFLDRVIIPITDASGRVIGFGGRTLDKERTPKYLNSPATPLFNKSAVLFGLNFAKGSIRQHNQAVVVEGYMDAIMAHQSGFTNVVAQMGTAFTDQQAKTLSKYSQNIVIALDGDNAGQKATKRGIDLASQFAIAEATTLDLKIMELPEGMDPDDLIRNDPEEWLVRVDGASPAVDYMIAAGKQSLPPNPTFKDREKLAHSLIPVLTGTVSKLAVETNIRKIATELNLPEDGLIQWMKEQKGGQKPPKVEETTNTTEQPLERALVTILCFNPGLLSLVRRRFRTIDQSTGLMLRGSDFQHWQYRALFETVEKAFDAPLTVDYDETLNETLPDDLRELFQQLREEGPQVYFDPALDNAKDLAPVQALRIKLLSLQRENTEIFGVQSYRDIYSANMRYISILNHAMRGG